MSKLLEFGSSGAFVKRRGRPPAQRDAGHRGAYNRARSIRSEAYGDLKPTRTPNGRPTL